MKKQAQGQAQMFQFEDTALFSQTPMEVQDEVYQPVKVVRVEGQTVEQAIEAAIPEWYTEAARRAAKYGIAIKAFDMWPEDLKAKYAAEYEALVKG